MSFSSYQFPLSNMASPIKLPLNHNIPGPVVLQLHLIQLITRGMYHEEIYTH